MRREASIIVTLIFSSCQPDAPQQQSTVKGAALCGSGIKSADVSRSGGSSGGGSRSPSILEQAAGAVIGAATGGEGRDPNTTSEGGGAPSYTALNMTNAQAPESCIADDEKEARDTAKEGKTSAAAQTEMDRAKAMLPKTKTDTAAGSQDRSAQDRMLNDTVTPLSLPQATTKNSGKTTSNNQQSNNSIVDQLIKAEMGNTNDISNSTSEINNSTSKTGSGSSSGDSDLDELNQLIQLNKSR